MYFIAKVVVLVFSKLFLHFEVRNRENVPSEGPFIIASNHISAYDPPLVGMASPRVCSFMAKRELFSNKFFGWVLRQLNAIPVNRSGFDKSVIERALEILGTGNGIILFPEGTRSRDGQIGAMKSGVGLLALKSGATVIPAFIKNSGRTAGNRLTRQKVVVTFAEPIGPNEAKSFPAGKDGYHELADEVRRRIKELKGDPVEAEPVDRDGT